jgi:hypothetical protein
MKSKFAYAFSFLCAIAYCHGQGTLVLGHFGSANPTNEGFGLLRGGSPSLTSVTNDLGYNAWSIGVSSAADIAQYKQTLTSLQSDTLSNGWILSLTLRVGQPVNPGDSGITAGFGGVGLDFGAQTNGDPAIDLNYSEYDFNGAGAGYHNYQVRFDATTDLATLWFDGIECLNDIPASANPTSLVWGEVQRPSGASYYANWSEVSVFAAPEPSTGSFVLLGSGVLFFLRHKYRR